MSLNPEKQAIIDQDGNVLVTANPGTGKTRLLAYKYVDLINKGIVPEQILCLTFTAKAKREMESRILEVIKKEKIDVDISKLNVFTFHSYALDNIEENEVLSTNLLRYAIFRFLKDKKILNYGDAYLLDQIVPKMENLMRYLKSFGITPDQIDLIEVKKNLEGSKSYSKEEIDKFADYFLAIYKHYEDIKTKRGVDYADLLIKFLQLKEIPQFEYVLIDELQDVNSMQADIALKSATHFFAVGDSKQAIFGFQGGSILNFKKFEKSTQSVLSENFRSTNEILSYASEYFTSKTKENAHKKELNGFRNANNETGSKPIIYEVETSQLYSVACKLVKRYSGKTAIITRNNNQIMAVAKELTASGLDFSSTFLSASMDAKNHIITFLRGVFSSNVQDVRNSMFTPFFPCSLHDAFQITEIKNIKLPELLEKLPLFKQMRESVKTVEDINKLFKEKIIPICISYGKEYLSAATTIQEAYQEALMVLPDKDIHASDKDIHALMSYLQVTDLLSQESDAEKEIVLTTVHKAKGKEFDNVIYLPKNPSNRSDFQNKVVKAIFYSKGINVEEELKEETLRVDFVAFTRAKKQLVILTDKVQDYLNDASESREIEAVEAASLNLTESKHRAFDLFVNGQFDEAKKLLENKDRWIKDFVKNHFESLEHTSFSSLPESAYDYFVNKMLAKKQTSYAMSLGSEVHEAVALMLSEKEYSASKDAKPFIENVKKIIEKIDYDEVQPERKLEPSLKSLGFDSELKFESKIDAVFRKGDEYLIVDWKTDKNTERSSEHRQQLETYKRVLSAHDGIPLDKIKVAIGFVGLRSTINTGKIDFEYDETQPAKSSFDTLSKRVERLLSWIKDPEQFFKDFIAEEKVKLRDGKSVSDDMIWKSVVEEYNKEK